MQSAERFWDAQRRERFLVVGLGELTGYSFAMLLARMGVTFKVSDCASLEELKPRLDRLNLRDSEVYAGPQDARQLEGITQILLSPGVPRNIALIRVAEERGIPVWSDYDFLYPIYSHKRIAAVTGTDGKTTTTALLGHLLRPSWSVVVAGNIGVPLAAVYDELLDCDAVVLELSSFMLERVTRFRADVSTVLNLAEDHVERYSTIERYWEAKRNILRCARHTDTFVRCLDDDRISRWDLSNVRLRTVAYRNGDSARADARVLPGALEVLGERLPLHSLAVRGAHLVEDVLVATLMASVVGVPTSAALRRATSFAGVPHRFESVGHIGRVEVIDDSKATSAHAAMRALESLGDRQTVLIIGGQDKHLSAAPLLAHEYHLRAVVGYGQAGERLLSGFTHVPTHYRHSFADAVTVACACTKDDDVLLLSPMCTSFDQHRDYRERGEEFRGLARRFFSTKRGESPASSRAQNRTRNR